jgi:hypothetical protein
MNHQNLSQQYEIRVRGHLDARWFDRLEGLTISLTPAGETIITGSIEDQAALYGLLNRIHDLGVYLLSVQHIPAEK